MLIIVPTLPLGHPIPRIVKFEWLKCLVLEAVPFLLPSVVPCDRLLQNGYLLSY